MKIGLHLMSAYTDTASFNQQINISLTQKILADTAATRIMPIILLHVYANVSSRNALL